MRVTVALVLVVLLGGCAGGDGTEKASAPPNADRLAQVEWRLTEIVEPSRSWQPPADAEVRLRFDGAGGWSGESCNHYQGSVLVDGATLSFSGGAGTDMFCSGVSRTLEQAFLGMMRGDTGWLVEAGELRLDQSDGWGLRFRVVDQLYPGRGITPLLQGHHGTAEYRLGWSACTPEICLQADWRVAPGKPWSTAGRADSRPSLSRIQADLGGVALVAAVAPRAAARVVYRPAPTGVPVDLTLFDIPGVSMGRVSAGLVERPSGTSSWTALDRQGRPLPW
ncbi:META domain-containing protein [Asanoa sp. WMMD1127]|uniref:META domain-containing protein n=1 Tax=Asanoa sp. WMMD1127 TaxID=3016107 RepID=UPI002416FBBD|nr:META domain-containing protein [Asanoa sp. WMMD1127]MDG4826929.1 META domain-containing protein [Asanoa sp. WMMD1127]